jgi:hypothetical protein
MSNDEAISQEPEGGQASEVMEEELFPVEISAAPIPQVEGAEAAKSEAIKADTIYESMQGEDDDEFLKQFYHFVNAEPDKQYYIHNPNPVMPDKATHNPITMHYLATRYYRPLKVDAPEGRIVMLVFSQGHPEHPAGYHQDVPAGCVIMTRDIKHKERERQVQYKKDNPGLQPGADDVKLVDSINGAMVQVKNMPFSPGSAELGNMLPTKDQIIANERRLQRAREGAPVEFYDALNRQMDKSLGR